MTEKPRIPLVAPELMEPRLGTLNVARTVAQNPALLKAWGEFAQYILGPKLSLTPRQRELAILRVGWNQRAEYEWAHHVVRGRASGLSDARILSLRGDAARLSGADAVLVRAVDALIDAACLPADLQAELVDLVGVDGLFDVIATVGLYRILGCLVKSFDTPIDADIAAALAAQPIG